MHIPSALLCATLAFICMGDSKGGTSGSRGSSGSRASSSSNRGSSGSGSRGSISNSRTGGVSSESNSHNRGGTAGSGSAAGSGTSRTNSGSTRTRTGGAILGANSRYQPQLNNNNNNVLNNNNYNRNNNSNTNTQTSSQWSTWSYGTNQNNNFNRGQSSLWQNRPVNHNASLAGQNIQRKWNSATTWAPWQPAIYSGRSLTRAENNKLILGLLLSSYLGGNVPRKIAHHNTKSHLIKYRRNYWIGERYYYLDPESRQQSRTTCFYELTAEDPQVFYEDNTQIKQIVFQCRTYFERCCGMDCCKTNVGINSARKIRFPFHSKIPALTLLIGILIWALM